jgi:dienelactone hydrolase
MTDNQAPDAPTAAALEPVSYECDGVGFRGYLAVGAGTPPRPGVLVCHESLGINEHVKRRTLEIAKAGYAAFALDMFGGEDLSIDIARHHSSLVANTPGLMFQRADAALKRLAAFPVVDPTRLAAVGFCLGGAVALELAHGGAPISCAIGFHPGLKRPAGSVATARPIDARILMLIGDDDPIAPIEDREEFAHSMKSANADWQMHIFGGVGHSYTNPAINAFDLPGFRYDELASRRAFAMALAFLAEAFARSDQS